MQFKRVRKKGRRKVAPSNFEFFQSIKDSGYSEHTDSTTTFQIYVAMYILCNQSATYIASN